MPKYLEPVHNFAMKHIFIKIFLWSAFLGLSPNCSGNLRQKDSSKEVILAREASTYGVVTVSQRGKIRYLKLGEQEQSAVNLENKRDWVYTYMYLFSLGILAKEPLEKTREQKVLIIGLGGGSFADFLAEVYPLWKIDVVELNGAVIRLAKKYFPIHRRVRIIEGDGRQFLERTHEEYDTIVMDAFGEHYIPPELYTVEYFTALKKKLNPQGIVLMNTWEDNPLENEEIQTLRTVFRKGFYIHHPRETPGNRIYILGDNLATYATLKNRIISEFSAQHFSGENPKSILEAMRDIEKIETNTNAITDKTVHGLFRKYRRN
ncbi:MAG: Polyamine aminopropyltransferase [Turneriella sp.]|nr:Polyamine aminopropyltransferase [Turneriella sp.]